MKHNVHLEVLCCEVLLSLYHDAVSQNLHLSLPEDEFNAYIVNRMRSELQERKNITLSTDACMIKRQAVLELAQHETHDQSVKDAWKQVPDSKRYAFEELLRLEGMVKKKQRFVKTELTSRRNTPSPSLSSTSKKKRARNTSPSPTAVEGASTMAVSVAEACSAVQTDHPDSEDKFIELSTSLDSDGNVISNRVKVGDVMTYLFELANDHRQETKNLHEEIKILKESVAVQARYINTLTNHLTEHFNAIFEKLDAVDASIIRTSSKRLLSQDSGSVNESNFFDKI